MKHILFFSFALILFAACSKHAGDTDPGSVEADKAQLRVARPTANSIYRIGDTVRIKAEAIAPATIHGYELSIQRPGDTSRIYYAHIHDHNDTLQIDRYWVNDRAEAQGLELRISLTLDHEGNQYVRTIPFIVQ
ncbi:hypothetical protein EPD60_16385 [Flaviaesturariibacter flavus]|uniref:DUF1425 domain-containing protein n=1 Tax=Flaviaesturariibacter flavus TaxID=2502780 RepID=A0A4R1B8B8_9BACT|nr:hypothetical protein [Flaviaesturariibacter flavus]TCJ12129.1 hypothetical protein EPD60_16385 [Flaviaesturariibacter flavus]